MCRTLAVVFFLLYKVFHYMGMYTYFKCTLVNSLMKYK